MSTFSTAVTKAQRNAIDYDLRRRAISICSRQNTNRPGYNPSPYEPPKPKPKEWSLGNALREKVLGVSKQIIKEKENKKHASAQVRPDTKRSTRKPSAPSRLDNVTLGQFYDAGCQFLHTGDNDNAAVLFAGIRMRSGDVCTTGCGWFNNGKCSTYRVLSAAAKVTP